MSGTAMKKISGYRGIMVLCIMISWILIQGIALAQEPVFLPLDQLQTGGPAMATEFSEVIALDKPDTSHSLDPFLYPVGALLFTILAGILVRFKHTRWARPLFLMGSLVVLGFINGGCPCPISGFQHILLAGLGQDFKINAILWFVGIVLVTYFFGRVWCGWVCHLGALQEFIYRSNRFEFLRSSGAQNIMRWTRYVLFTALVIQLVATKDIQFNHIDPFRVAFNLSSFHPTGWILLGFLIATSLFIYRPFCRAACPIGLLLGLVHRLPGAALIGKTEQCVECRSCQKVCLSQAIDGHAMVSNGDCIVCGDCLNGCKKEGLSQSRKKCIDASETLPYSGRKLPANMPHTT